LVGILLLLNLLGLSLLDDNLLWLTWSHNSNWGRLTIDNFVQSFLHFVGTPSLEDAALVFGIFLLSLDDGKLLNSLLEFE